jgi:hypothetical protein
MTTSLPSGYFTCPVCGWPFLSSPAYFAEDTPSDEICLSCGIQFGYTDWGRGDQHVRRRIRLEWRRRWLDEGARWSGGSTPPSDWDGRRQLERMIEWGDPLG